MITKTQNFPLCEQKADRQIAFLFSFFLSFFLSFFRSSFCLAWEIFSRNCSNRFTVLTKQMESYLTNVCRYSYKDSFRPILDKTEICRQRAVKIVNVRQQCQESRWNSTVPCRQTGRRRTLQN
jgi:hypothetical protein